MAFPNGIPLMAEERLDSLGASTADPESSRVRDGIGVESARRRAVSSSAREPPQAVGTTR
jgi:hypothetical protein